MSALNSNLTLRHFKSTQVLVTLTEYRGGEGTSYGLENPGAVMALKVRRCVCTT